MGMVPQSVNSAPRAAVAVALPVAPASLGAELAKGLPCRVLDAALPFHVLPANPHPGQGARCRFACASTDAKFHVKDQ
jgi:hypothetical protein